MTHSFKIRPVKILSKDEKCYVFCSSRSDLNSRFSIPKSQVLKFEKITIKNPYTKTDEDWIEIVVTDWIWHKKNLKEKLNNYKIVDSVVISNETHFGINWDYVIMKKRDRNHCFFCQCKLNSDGKEKTNDHVIPKAVLKAYGLKGGIANNTVPCCKEDNREKANLHPEIYRELVRRKIHEGGDLKYRTILFTLNELLKIK